MNRDTDLFVQAFWVKCRETIRPELDQMVGELNDSGHQAHVSTQEYSDVADKLPDPGPSLILTVHAPARRRPARSAFAVTWRAGRSKWRGQAKRPAAMN